ncbi:MAG: hypothetical protein J6W03_01375 [Bacteroidaceae bacterium]|nr:hypothetical protein [Bacteroidaceae bacterium]
MRDRYKQIKTEAELVECLSSPEQELRRVAFQGVDFTSCSELSLKHFYRECLFVSCRLPMGLKRQSKDCLFLPNMGEEFGFPNHLYSPEELYEGFSPERPESYESCYDGRVYRHFLKKGKYATDVKETLARTLHDHSISDCLQDFLSRHDEHKLVGVMGGHSLSRLDKAYVQVARLSKRLAELGFLMITGGGPGAMEATHLGAWMAGRSEEELQEALSIMSVAPIYTDKLWLSTAWEVHNRFPNLGYESLGVPTWLYGHEPSTPLATHIAKYFDNSIREDGILTISKGGIIYTPGSAGTLQEIFQEAVQNHYLTFGYASPMIFMGKEFWTEEVPVWPLIMTLVDKGRYKNLILCLTDEVADVERVLQGK